MTYFWACSAARSAGAHDFLCRVWPSAHRQTFPTASDGRAFVSSDARHFVMTGTCGGYTAFSSFSLADAQSCMRWRAAARDLNIVSSVVLCLLAVWGEYAAASALNRLKRT
jgi:CrcB protein